MVQNIVALLTTCVYNKSSSPNCSTDVLDILPEYVSSPPNTTTSVSPEHMVKAAEQ